MLVNKSKCYVNLICILFFNSWDNNEREKMSFWDMELILEGSKYVFKIELLFFWKKNGNSMILEINYFWFFILYIVVFLDEVGVGVFVF